MKTSRIILFQLLFLLIFFSISCETKKTDSKTDSKVLAQTPPMGWNSYDCFGAAVRESEIKENADYMAENLKEYGWEYIVVDYCWYYPHPPGSTQDNPPQFRLPRDNAPVPWMPMDEFGRLRPDPGKFPGSVPDSGFKYLGDYIHSLGLKFGIHLMRGIPRQAVWNKTPIKGTDGITADQIADTSSVCPWLNLMYGVDMTKEGAQEYYNSLFELYAEWGVDFVKVDDIDVSHRKRYRDLEVEGYKKAIENCGRPMVLSLSPEQDHDNHKHMGEYAHMYRISQDFWDRWHDLRRQFDKCALYQGISGPGNWPDADMLPIGNLRLRGPFGEPEMSRFTEAEQYTLLTLWSIFRSPLMIGGNLPDNDKFTLSLITNPDVLYVNQNSSGAQEIYNEDNFIIWKAKDSVNGDTFYAIFNLDDNPREFKFDFDSFAAKNELNIYDLWLRKDLGKFKDFYICELAAHGASLIRTN